ncbi:MAG TPA: TonB-dependent receptor [Allosphingosinicella sp.]|jgi:iron complex outermembrane receptor protein
MKAFALFLTTTALAALPAAARAADAPVQGTDHVHTEEPEEIVVTANFIRDLDLLAGTEVLTGTELVRDLRPQLGDTLARLPGVSATSFSPGASRPVLRGFQGERIRVLTDGVGSIDVSNTSADHAVTIDPLTAERIEVLHGPAVLLFGGQAIGGAVNVLDRRIPRRVPDEVIHIDALASYGSAADEQSVGGSIDIPLGGGFVGHVDGSYRNTDDLKVGGFVLSPRLRAEQLAVAAEEQAEGHAEEAAEARELANLRGRIPNSATETKTLGAGLALIGDRGSLGFSLSWYDSNYGVPARPGAEHHHEKPEGEHEEAEQGGHDEHGEAPVTIGLEQFRGDVRGEFEVGGGFVDKLRLRLAAADYEHTEFEGEEVGTIFRTQGMEGRFELVQADRAGWRGVSGVQYFARDFAAVGAEAFVPPNETSQLGLFTLQEFDLGKAGIEAAGRWERTRVGSNEVGVARTFNAYSGAFGGSYAVTPRIKIGANVSRSERAPAAEELFSNGPHIATQAFEIGDPDLQKEKSWGAEAYVRADTRDFNLSLSAFANWFDDYIFEAATGEEQDELPVFRYFQRDARYYGFEGEISATLFRAGGFRFVGDVVADYVHASIKEGGPVPRIPPLRVLAGIEAQSESIDGRIEAEWSADQDRVAAFETPTDGHLLVGASVAWRPWGKRNPTTFLVSANNIFDVDARRHASFTKDYVPLAGRDIRLSARFSF